MGDTHCIQFAILCFGPWKQMFSFIYTQFQDPELVNPVLDYFHGHSSVWSKKLKTTQGFFLLRYNSELVKRDSKLKAALRLCYTTNNGELKEEYIFRKPPYSLTNKKQNKVTSLPAGWAWKEKIPGRKRSITKKRKVLCFARLLDDHKGSKHFKKPVMYGSA